MNKSGGLCNLKFKRVYDDSVGGFSKKFIWIWPSI